MVYRVLADGIDIYGSDTESSLLSPSLETELNSAGSLEFTLPPDHPSYDDISLMQTEVEVYEDDDLIFFGRPAEVGIDWNKQKKVVCEGALAYLNDAAIRPHKFEGALISDVFKYIIAQYNAQVAQNKQFIVGNITIVDRYVYTEFDYDICLSVLISTCIDSTGGYLFLRKEEAGIYIDWLAEVPDASDQPVQFASNMLDLNQDTRAEDICTVVLPVGGQVDGTNITIAPVNQGSDILEDSDAIAKYGRILKIQQWNDIVDPQALKDKATEWLAKQQEDDITIETDAAELHYLDGSVGAYRIGQLVNVISGPHGVDKEYPILKMSMNLDSGTKKITLGTPPRKELTELSGITNSTGGGSSSGGGGGGGSTGVTDVLVNGSSVVSDHIARISAVTPQQLNDGLATKANQSDLNALSTVVAGKASQADLNALSNTVSGKQDQLTPGTGISIDANNVISATGGGGTDVEANPSEPATDDLETIKIGNTVYDISGGGTTTNYGKFKCDMLFNTPTTTSAWANPIEICSEEKAKEYDMIYLITKFVDGTSNGFISNSYLVNSIGKTSDSDWMMGIRSNSVWNNPEGFIFLSFDDSKLKFYTNTGNSSTLYKVYGLKFENKLINRSDIYSEEERMIGRWTDGKPLYQKTYRNIRVTNNADNVVDSNFGTDKNICTHNIEFRGISGNYRSDYNNSVNDTLYSNNNGQLIYYFYKSGNWSQLFDTLDVTLQYTKTTDAPGSGFLPEDPMIISDPMIYSEEEQVVGSWTDGKPLYQKTIVINNPVSTGATTSITHGIADIETIVDVYGGAYLGPTCIDLNSFGSYTYYTLAYAGTTNFAYELKWGSSTFTKICATIQYTKTTDSILSGPKKGKIIQRSDIYSEEERMIGRWTDGKPLYQKTYDLGAATAFPNNTWTTIVSNVTIPFDKIIKCVGVQADPAAVSFDIWFDSSSSSLKVRSLRDGNESVRYFALQYTKTTDRPGSGFLPEDPQMVMMSDYYSEDEQVVGRWTDGKPLYQKTMTYDFTSSVNDWTLFDDSVSYEKMVAVIPIMTAINSSEDQIMQYGDSETAPRWCIKNDHKIYYYLDNARRKGVVTFQYTKSTDAPGTGPTKGNLIYLPALYSEEEREVGVWTDGKPLYQKTFVGNINLETSTWTELGSVANVEELVFIKGTVDYGTGVTEEPYIRGRYYSGKVYYYTNQLVPGTGHGNITIQYTKTTDQPGSGTWTPEGQLAHHYSTSEKIVGTWIDGRSIYEKSYQFTSSKSFNTGWTATAFVKPTGLASIIDSELFRSEDQGDNAHSCSFGSTYIELQLPMTKTIGSPSVLTIRYLKTS